MNSPWQWHDNDFVQTPEKKAKSRLPAITHGILLLSVLAFLSALLWAHYAELDEITRAEGKIIPSSRIQKVQNLEGGILSAILVREGDQVEAGEILLQIDDTRFASSFRESKYSEQSLKAEKLRLLAELNDQPFIPEAAVREQLGSAFSDEQALYQARTRARESGLAIFQQQLRQRQQQLNEGRSRLQNLNDSMVLADKELALTIPLAKRGSVSQVELIKVQRQVTDLKGKLEQSRLSQPRLEAAVEEARYKIEEKRRQIKAEINTELSEVNEKLLRINENNLALQDRVARTAVRSPVKGTVNKLNINTIGGVVQPGMDLVEIVPTEDSLLVEARVRPTDIAFLHPKLSATVKVTAYDFAIYGGLDARLEHISADTITTDDGESFYQIQVRTEKNYLGNDDKPLPIIPGMVASVDIKTGKKSVLDYLLKPMYRAKELALRER
ncbi:HlyD family type I secretion periplasmic adaptor subunit [Endozoicomonas euniceicola]|uniref:Membrane fusion protein (MFP) family protein n=1 Tax=Endozoicomonas euniceicola TaxID=1234143 RepID=A0ABY6H0Z9_9GAMM|nr:HlyD family type I secretion periplasmic adaptor subunit [Endozoicomonas euniceicola]UYM18294.1 HlyD family type I secretion periplasmic adaptor subunit [Endozoicomonas euniceicola]